MTSTQKRFPQLLPAEKYVSYGHAALEALAYALALSDVQSYKLELSSRNSRITKYNSERKKKHSKEHTLERVKTMLSCHILSVIESRAHSVNVREKHFFIPII